MLEQYQLVNKQGDNGFTLVELAIVLVIIGLIVGGLLVGQSLISSAKIRSFISQIDRYTIATNAFRTKYDCIPGDCINAEGFGLGSASNPGANGNGDGKIFSPLPSGSYLGGSWAVQQERLNFWYHLSQAQMIAENVNGYDTTTQPADMTGYNPPSVLGTAESGVTSISPDSQNGVNKFFATSFTTNSYGAIFNVLEAWGVDSKIDDGKPHTGKVVTTFPQGRPRLQNGGFTRCAGHSATGNADEYDLEGRWAANAGEAVEDRPNRTRIECGLAFLNRF